MYSTTEGLSPLYDAIDPELPWEIGVMFFFNTYSTRFGYPARMVSTVFINIVQTRVNVGIAGSQTYAL